MYGVVLHAHPVRGESHNKRNTTGEVATITMKTQKCGSKSVTGTFRLRNFVNTFAVA